MDIVTAITATLVPALPYLLQGTEAVATEANKKLGSAVWDHCTKVWELLRPKVESSPSASKALERIINQPERQGIQAAFQVELEDILLADPQLFEELAELLKAAGDTQTYHASIIGDGAVAQGERAIAAGKGSVAVGGNVTGNIAIGENRD